MGEKIHQQGVRIFRLVWLENRNKHSNAKQQKQKSPHEMVRRWSSKLIGGSRDVTVSSSFSLSFFFRHFFLGWKNIKVVERTRIPPARPHPLGVAT